MRQPPPLSELSTTQQTNLTTRERIRSWINTHPRLYLAFGTSAVAIVITSVSLPVFWMLYDSSRTTQVAQLQVEDAYKETVEAKWWEDAQLVTARKPDKVRAWALSGSENQFLKDQKKRNKGEGQRQLAKQLAAEKNLADLKKQIEQERRLAEIRKRQFDLQKSIGARRVTGTYLVGGGHWVKEKVDLGKIIILEDRSIWKIYSLDRLDTGLWLPLDNVTVIENPTPIGMYQYKLINSNDRTSAQAQYLGK